MSATPEIEDLQKRVKYLELVLERFTPANAIARKQHKLEQAAQVEQVVCDEYGLFPYQLHLNTRRLDVVYPRQQAMWLLRQLGWTSTEVGAFYDRDHCTVLHAESAVQDQMDIAPGLKTKLMAWLNQLKGEVKP